MRANCLLIPVLLFWSLVLTGCSNPETPQEVSQAFWQALIGDDAETATELSTLVDENGFDGYSLNWSDARISWGRVNIEGGQASIGTVITGVPQMEGEALDTTTYLVNVNDQWQVDYHRTGDQIRADRRLDSLAGSFRALGDSLRSRLADETGQAAREMNRLAEELSSLTDETRRELSTLIERYGENLERRMDEFSRSLDEAQGQSPDASAEDRQILEQARKELQQQQQSLDIDEPDSLAQASQQLAQIWRQISTLSGQSFERLKEQLDQWARELNRELEQLNQEARLERHHSI